MTPPSEPASVVSKSDLIKKIGQTLEERRKARGFSLEKITQSIKIRAGFLKAIEAGEWKDLPGEVYARGFIGRYAQHLGLDPKELLGPYLDYENAVDKIPTPSQGPSERSPFPKGGYVGVGVGVLVLIAVFKFIASDLNNGKKKVPEVAPTQAEIKATPLSSSTPLAEIKSSEHRLEVFSPFPLWLSVKAENRSFEGFLPQESTWSWKATGHFSIRLGHTQQVTLNFDGAPVTLGENQKKVTLPSEN